MKVITTKDIFEMIEKGRRDFRNSKFYGVDFRGKDISGVIFDCSSFEFCFLRNGRFVGTSFKNCEFKFSGFASSDLTEADFENAKIEFTDFDSSIFNNTNFKNSRLSYVSFVNVNVAEADLTGATKFRVVESWNDVTEEEWDLIFSQIGSAKISLSDVMRIKRNLINAKESGKEIKLSYGDFGNKFLASSDRAYQISEGGKQSEVYVPFGGAYTSTTNYDVKVKGKLQNSYK